MEYYITCFLTVRIKSLRTQNKRKKKGTKKKEYNKIYVLPNSKIYARLSNPRDRVSSFIVDLRSEITLHEILPPYHMKISMMQGKCAFK